MSADGRIVWADDELSVTVYGLVWQHHRTPTGSTLTGRDRAGIPRTVRHRPGNVAGTLRALLRYSSTAYRIPTGLGWPA